MAEFKEISIIDKIEIVELGTVQVREATIVQKDGEEIARTYRRWALDPGSDISGQPGNVQAVCRAVWTAEVIEAYENNRPKEI